MTIEYLHAMDKKKKTRLVKNNLTAKYSGRYNRAQVFRDRKKDSKRGYEKHKEKN